jgi:anti-sigma factor RsiW
MKTSFRDVELLSAYLDGALDPSETARLEARIESDPELRAVRDDLRAARNALRSLPVRKSPRRLTLTPQMAGVKPPLPRAYPALRFAAVVTTLMCFFSFTLTTLNSIPLGAAAPAAPAFGMGGRGGAADESFAAATEAPAEEPVVPLPEAGEPPAQMQPAPTLEAAAPELLAVVTPTPDHGLKEFAVEKPLSGKAPCPNPWIWSAGLLGLTLLLAGSAWLVRTLNDRTWHGKAR